MSGVRDRFRTIGLRATRLQLDVTYLLQRFDRQLHLSSGDGFKEVVSLKSSGTKSD